MALTDKQCRAATPRDKTYQLSDGNGLALEVRPSGKKYWIVRMWSDGKETRRSLGPYPTVTLREARVGNIAMRATPARARGGLFDGLIDDWLERRVEGVLAPGYVRVIRLRVERLIRPSLGRLHVDDITSDKILDICRVIEDAGTVETAHRVRQLIGQIFRFAIATGRAKVDPTVALHGALTPSRTKHYATLTTDRECGDLMRRIDGYQGLQMRLAMLFSVYTAARPGEVRRAEWTEIDLGKAEWRLPPEKMKMKRPHIVPMSDQLVAVVRDLQVFNGHYRWLFPSARSSNRPMSDNGVRTALRAMGYANEDLTPHGFRAMFSTVANEHGWPPDVIERQLAHVERNAVRRAYDRSEHLAQRRELMQWWADWLDKAKS